MKAELVFIGHIETPYKTKDECPRNISKDGPLCTIVLKEKYEEGLYRLEPGQKILILYWFENVNRKLYRQYSGKTGRYAGLFALRTPNRPNPIAAATLKIEKIEGCRIFVKGLDCISGTPLLDIKPDINDIR
ncbi:MAG: SAM-dependent methyltransferase [Victivallales bacterium]|nr:SAM-dependent methyltransferase [Victivallales bacterium]